MRAGAFTESRVIHLLNRRFVPFYFNTGGPGLGRDEQADEFVKGKMENPHAYLAAFSPSGELLGTTKLYADKDEVFEFLRQLLKRYPEYAQPSKDELEILRTADSTDLESRLIAATIREELGEYDAATEIYHELKQKGIDPTIRTEAFRGLARITRYREQWDLLDKILSEAESSDIDRFASDAAMERVYRLIDSQQYANARELAEETIEEFPNSHRIAELRFYAGVAAFFHEGKGRSLLSLVLGRRTPSRAPPSATLLYCGGARGDALSQSGAGRLSQRTPRW